MKTAIEVFELFLSYGINLIIVISILFLVQGLKKYFNLKKKIAFLILISLGVLAGVLKIILSEVIIDLYLTVIFGYAGISSLLYVAIDIFLPAIKEKFFPSTKQINENEDK